MLVPKILIVMLPLVVWCIGLTIMVSLSLKKIDRTSRRIDTESSLRRVDAIRESSPLPLGTGPLFGDGGRKARETALGMAIRATAVGVEEKEIVSKASHFLKFLKEGGEIEGMTEVK